MLFPTNEIIRPALDLTKYHARQRHGDVTVYLTWWRDPDDGWVPVLVLVPSFSRLSDYQPCVVTVDLAWIWSEEHGNPRFAAQTAASFCVSLGFSPTPKKAIRIASIIRDHLDDLLKIPPRPRDDYQVVADAIMKAESGRERHVEIADVG